MPSLAAMPRAWLAAAWEAMRQRNQPLPSPSLSSRCRSSMLSSSSGLQGGRRGLQRRLRSIGQLSPPVRETVRQPHQQVQVQQLAMPRRPVQRRHTWTAYDSGSLLPKQRVQQSLRQLLQQR